MKLWKVLLAFSNTFALYAFWDYIGYHVLNKILRKCFNAELSINVLFPSTPYTFRGTTQHSPLLEPHPIATIKNHSFRNFIRLRLGKIAGTSEVIVYILNPDWGRCVMHYWCTMAPVDKNPEWIQLFRARRDCHAIYLRK